MYDPHEREMFNVAQDLHILALTSDPAHLAIRADRLATVIHSRNVKAGWWTDISTGLKLKRNFGELLMLIVSEVSESVQAHQLRAMDDKLPHHRGDAVEIADALIRILDTAGAFATAQNSIGIELAARCGTGTAVTGDFTYDMMQVVVHLCNAMEADRKGQPFLHHLAEAFMWLLQIARNRNMDVAEILPEKLHFNAQRSDHKIENRLKEDGKKY